MSSSSSLPTTTLPEGYQDVGNALIWQAAQECCCKNTATTINNIQDIIQIEWKPGRIIVTITNVPAYVDATTPSPDDEEIETDDDDDEDEATNNNNEDDDDVVDDETETTSTTLSSKSEGVDVVALARAINRALDGEEPEEEDEEPSETTRIGRVIAETHEIEVTTPGASNELLGAIMFEAYKGFDVLVDYVEENKKSSSKKTNKTLSGRLVERNDTDTVINIKGRMKKIPNETINSVQLPKAKKEKGGG